MRRFRSFRSVELCALLALSCSGPDDGDPATVELAALGQGIQGQYFNNQDFTGTSITRNDATIDFDWASGAPASGFGSDTFSVRWIGSVVPQFTQTYTFYTVSDDGVRLWINNQQIINNWTNHAATENRGTIALTAGQRTPIRMEYFEAGGLATARLNWSSASQPRQPIPQSRLDPVSGGGGGGSGGGGGTPKSGMFVEGRFLKDPCGQTVTIRGYEQPVGRSLLEANAGIPEMARTGANYARLLVQIPPRTRPRFRRSARSRRTSPSRARTACCSSSR